MKNNRFVALRLPAWIAARALLLAAACLVTTALHAGDRTAATVKPAATAKPAAAANATQSGATSPDVIQTASETPDYVNWIEVGTGGMFINGDKDQFKKSHALSGDVYGGIEDMHYQHDIGEGGLFELNGRAMFETKDYNIEMELSKVDLGYIKAGYNQFRTWYDDGSYFPMEGAKNFNNLLDEELAIDRGSMWVEMGLRMPDVPQITLRYTHDYRNGQKDSTIWGPTNYIGVAPFAASNPAGASSTSRLYVPAFRDINERRDTLTADTSHTFGNTEINLGMRYEYTFNEDTLYMTRNPGQITPVASKETRITQESDLDSDLFSGHAATVTRFNDQLWLTSGYSYTTMDTTTGGSRIYGPNFDAAFNPAGGSPQGTGFISLDGSGTVVQHVGSVNLMWMPCDSLSITPEIRVENTHISSDVDYMKTKATPQAARRFVTVNSANDYFTVAEGLEVRYTGINDWVFYARADLEQEDGNRWDTSDNAYNTNGALLDLDEQTTLLRQKYTVGTNWYPLPKLNFSAQYFHKIDLFSNDIHDDDPISVDNQRMTNLNLKADDVNFRATWRPLSNLSLVTRYDFLLGKTESRWKDPEEYFDESEASELTNHILSESITWNPFTRWYLQGTGSYVFNRLHTPASDNVEQEIIRDSENNYYTFCFATGVTIDDKTDIKADFSYYKSDNYENNGNYGMPYGAESEEYTISAGLNRQISPAVRISLKYAYYSCTDTTSGYLNDYDGHLIYAGSQIRF